MAKESYFAAEGKHCDRNSLKAGKRQGSPRADHQAATCHQEGLSRLSSYTPNSTKPWQLFALYLADREARKWAFYAFLRTVRRDRHTRRIIKFIGEAESEVLFVTIWFARFVSEEQAKRIGARLLRRLTVRLVESWVRVIELHKDRRPHLHFVIRLAAGLEQRIGIRKVRVELRRRAERDGVKRCYVARANNADALSRYLVKTYGQPGRARGRVITYSKKGAA